NKIYAFDKIILKKMGIPIKIQADHEFNKKDFLDYCKKFNIETYFWKPHENPKNQIVERAIKTLKKLILKYIYKYGWPKTNDMKKDAQKVLDACTWYYNRKFHSSIKSTPKEVFFGNDFSRQKIIKFKIPSLEIGTIVFRKPIREIGVIKKGVFHFDPEPFVIVGKEGNLQGKYKI
ncbi:MAG: hypothetical protein NZZ41_08285, partial [Candidatus Dojkabacteria bacterium]|nr:hypothetical protein [Candidatus Dojkabacteria bacterium]